MTTDIPNDKKARLLASLAMHTGSESVFLHWTKRRGYTEGVQALAGQGGGYWLIDLIASWTLEPRVHRTKSSWSGNSPQSLTIQRSPSQRTGTATSSPVRKSNTAIFCLRRSCST